MEVKGCGCVEVGVVVAEGRRKRWKGQRIWGFPGGVVVVGAGGFGVDGAYGGGRVGADGVGVVVVGRLVFGGRVGVFRGACMAVGVLGLGASAIGGRVGCAVCGWGFALADDVHGVSVWGSERFWQGKSGINWQLSPLSFGGRGRRGGRRRGS